MAVHETSDFDSLFAPKKAKKPSGDVPAVAPTPPKPKLKPADIFAAIPLPLIENKPVEIKIEPAAPAEPHPRAIVGSTARAVSALAHGPVAAIPTPAPEVSVAVPVPAPAVAASAVKEPAIAAMLAEAKRTAPTRAKVVRSEPPAQPSPQSPQAQSRPRIIMSKEEADMHKVTKGEAVAWTIFSGFNVLISSIVLVVLAAGGLVWGYMIHLDAKSQHEADVRRHASAAAPTPAVAATQAPSAAPATHAVPATTKTDPAPAAPVAVKPAAPAVKASAQAPAATAAPAASPATSATVATTSALPSPLLPTTKAASNSIAVTDAYMPPPLKAARTASTAAKPKPRAVAATGEKAVAADDPNADSFRMIAEAKAELEAAERAKKTGR